MTGHGIEGGQTFGGIMHGGISDLKRLRLEILARIASDYRIAADMREQTRPRWGGKNPAGRTSAPRSQPSAGCGCCAYQPSAVVISRPARCTAFQYQDPYRSMYITFCLI